MNIFDAVNSSHKVSLVKVCTDLGSKLNDSGTRGIHHTHADTSESDGHLSIYDNGSKFKCHSCGQQGDLIAFYSYDKFGDNHSQSRYQACKELIDKYDIDYTPENWTPQRKAEQKKRDAENNLIQSCLDDAVGFFRKGVDNDYLLDRGLTQKTIDEYQVGYAPADWNSLEKHLRSKGHKRDALIKTGLFKVQEDGRLTTRMYDRHIFPYYYGGRVSYINGRDAGKCTNPKYKDRKKAKYLKLGVANNVNNPYIENRLWGEDALVQEMNRHKTADKQGETLERKRVLIVEGIIDAIIAKQEYGDSYLVVSPCAAQISKKDFEKTINLFKGARPKEVVICMDSDTAGKNGAENVAKYFIDEFTYYEDKNGNYYTAKHAKELYAEIKQAKKKGKPPVFSRLFKKQLRCPIKIARLPEYEDKVDFADYIQQKRKIELTYWLDSAVNYWRYKLLADKDPQGFTKDGVSEHIRVKYVADELELSGRHFKGIGFTSNRVGGIYEYGKGVYKDNSDEIRKQVNLSLGVLTYPTIVNNSLHQINNRHVSNMSVFEHPNLINCQNCFVDVSDVNEFKVEEHSPLTPSITQYPWAYDETGECPNFEKFVSEVVRDYDRDIIFEMFGHCLLQKTGIQKMFVLYDEDKAGTGKSTMLKILQMLLGEDNYSNLSMQDLCDPQNPYAVSSLIGKAANIYADLPTATIKDFSIIRAITTPDEIEARGIYKGQLKFTPYSTLVFSCNFLPNIDAYAQKDRDRFSIIEFPFRFRGVKGVEVNQEMMLDRMKPELGAIAHKALQAIRKAILKGGLSESENSLRIAEEHASSADSVINFVTRRVAFDPSRETTMAELRKAFVEDYKKEDTITEAALYRRIKEHVEKGTEITFAKKMPRKRFGGTKALSFMKGVYLVDGKTPTYDDNVVSIDTEYVEPANSHVQEYREQRDFEMEERQALQNESLD